MIGTTPTYAWKIPFDVSMIDAARVTFKQGNKTVLEKDTADLVLEGNKVSVTLTQEETFLFNMSGSIRVQLRTRTKAGQVLKTQVIALTPTECLDKEVL